MEIVCSKELPQRDQSALPPSEALSYLHLDLVDEMSLGYSRSSWAEPLRSKDDLHCKMHSINQRAALHVVMFVNLFFTTSNGERTLGPFPLQFQGNVSPDRVTEIRYVNTGRTWVHLDFMSHFIFNALDDVNQQSGVLQNVSVPEYYLEPGQPVAFLPIHSVLTCNARNFESLFWRPDKNAVLTPGTHAFLNVPGICKKPPPFAIKIPEVEIERT